MTGQADELPEIFSPVPNAPTCVFRARLCWELQDWNGAALAALDTMHHLRDGQRRAQMFALAADAFAAADLAAEVDVGEPN